MSLLRFGFSSSGKRNGGESDSECKSTSKDSKYDSTKRKRTFLQSWTNTWPWVRYDEQKGEMFCIWCREHPELADKQSALFKGTHNLKVDPLKSHDLSFDHKNCALTHLRQSASNADTAKPKVSQTVIGKAIHKLTSEQQSKLQCLFNTAYAVGKSGKPFKDFGSQLLKQSWLY